MTQLPPHPLRYNPVRASGVRTRAALLFTKECSPMSIIEVLTALAAAVTILEFLWKVGRWLVEYKRRRIEQEK